MLERGNLVLIVVDIQEKLLPTIPHAPAMIAQCQKLIQAARALDIPLLLTEQYPRGLGPTARAIAGECDGTEPIEKVSFGCMGDEGFRKALEASGRRQLLLCGIETHVCVMQTALMAVDAGYDVYLAVDAVAANAEKHHAAALNRMERAGVTLVTVEMALFELLGVAGTAEFKEVLSIIK